MIPKLYSEAAVRAKRDQSDKVLHFGSFEEMSHPLAELSFLPEQNNYCHFYENTSVNNCFIVFFSKAYRCLFGFQFQFTKNVQKNRLKDSAFESNL